MQFISLNQLPLYTDDFFFTFWQDINKKDTIVIFNPLDAMIVSPVFLRSRKSLEEHINYINCNNLTKAIVIGDNIEFLRQCPSLECLKVYPSINAEDFDYSPIYDLHNLKWIHCETMYGLKAMYDVKEKIKVSNIDYGRFHGLKRLVVNGQKGHLNVKEAGEVISLQFSSGFPGSNTLINTIPGSMLRSLSICEAPIQSLDGIEDAPKLQRLELSYNRRLTDISALRHLCETLAYLEIDTCGKIHDFSVLSKLHNLEYLTLKGSNTLPNLSFLRDMPNLKNLHLWVNVEDGDLTRCLDVPYVRIQNRKHYSHKDKDMPKKYTDPEKRYSFGDI